MLGALSVKLDFPHEIWLAALKNKFGKELIDINIAAFDLGRNIMNQSIAK